MDKVSDKFNFSGDLAQQQLLLDKKKLTPEGAQIFEDFEKGLKAAEIKRRDDTTRDRAKNAALTATRWTSDRLVLQPGPHSSTRPFDEKEVSSLQKRAKMQATTIDRVKPLNAREATLQKAYVETVKWEKGQEKIHETQIFDNCRKLMDNLLTMHLARTAPQLTKEFNRVR